MHDRVGNILFSSDFDSGNLAYVEQTDSLSDDTSEKCYDNEFKVWTAPDAAGTPNENGNRTWFHFSVQGRLRNKTLKFTVMNMNKQSKLFMQGMSPVYKVGSSLKSRWQRIRERPSHEVLDGQFQLTFCHNFGEVLRTEPVFFAFTYPYSYEQYQDYLKDLEHSFSSTSLDIYFHRDLLCLSNDGLNIDLLTVSSTKNMTDLYESNIEKLYPDPKKCRAKIFNNKKMVFLTSRVHPGETQSSFVSNGFLKFILNQNDKRARTLLDLFVFKLVPMLNPDGVKRGHYRTDSNGINLNRVYTSPDFTCHPSIYAVKKLMEYHQFNSDIKTCEEKQYNLDSSAQSLSFKDNECNNNISDKDKQGVKECCEKNETDLGLPLLKPSLDNIEEQLNTKPIETEIIINKHLNTQYDNFIDNKPKTRQEVLGRKTKQNNEDINKINENRRIDVYVDLHGHASKQGCFIYGNHFENGDDLLQCMLFPKLISLNSAYFDFNSCNFSERNMYHKDKRDGQSKEGSGRVAMGKLLNIVHSYTLECNYNSGRSINQLAPISSSESSQHYFPCMTTSFSSRYAPGHYEEVGSAVAIALLDLFNKNPMSRLPLSHYKSLAGVQNWLRKFMKLSKHGMSKKNKDKKPNKYCNQGFEPKTMVASSTNAAIKRFDNLTKPTSKTMNKGLKTPLIFLQQLEDLSTLSNKKDFKPKSQVYRKISSRKNPEKPKVCIIQRKLISPNLTTQLNNEKVRFI